MGQPPDRGHADPEVDRGQLPDGGAALVQDELPLLLAPHQGHGQERYHLHGRGRLGRKISSHLPSAEEKTSKDQTIKQISGKDYNSMGIVEDKQELTIQQVRDTNTQERRINSTSDG